MTPNTAPAPRDTIIDLLQNFGTKKEIDQYLRAFQGVETSRFAVVKVGGGLLLDEMDELASTLAFLSRIGLLPIVIHGAGPQLTAALKDENIDSHFVAGSRVTTPEVLAVARRVFQRECVRLCEQLEARGARARPIVSGVFEAKRTNESSMGWVGVVSKVDLSLVSSAIDSGQIPVISSLGVSPEGQTLNINADVAARELALAVQPRKVIFLTPTSGLLDPEGRVIPAVNLEEDLERMIASSWVSGGMALKLREIKRLLDQMPATSSVSVTSSRHLVRELFTHKGQGTLIQRGVRIAERKDLSCVDVPRLVELLESSFQKRLKEGWLQEAAISRILLANDFSAVAIVTSDGPAPYLDKFAVTSKAQGAGIGASLWNRLVASEPEFFWRSRRANQINPWYFERADGAVRRGDWVIFWKGLRDPDHIAACVEHAAALPQSFHAPEQAAPPDIQIPGATHADALV
ncbi:MAG: acetylglutamate kinase [Phycisphaeraceae bacterium]|nr:acetylglutamate kinase [Phycisphaeraceae bacterium]MCB9848658.1 acetylglutamate kinase [Phycisphaeraceae bacterium]